MAPDPKEVVAKLLANTTNEEVLNELVAPDATYVSLNYDNPTLKEIMPWCGTHDKAGPSAIYETFVNVGRHWENKDFSVKGCFGAGEDVAVFGSFTYTSRYGDEPLPPKKPPSGSSIDSSTRSMMRITKTSPFAIWAKVNAEGRIVYMQFMEDTLATSSTFEKSGTKTYRADPNGHEVSF
ncbi:hypothetical protein MMC26_007602 [Xylographa opegraphella]|nr:hypothetical protein [Xylographa opegraphella]